MELVDITDNNGIYTGKVMDRKKVNDLKLPHLEVVIFLINENNQILLQKRSSNKRFNPNKWAPCAGGVWHNESIEEGALRELKEEIGVEFKKEDLNFLTKDKTTSFYFIKCNKKENEFTLQEEELSCVKWFDIDEVIDKIKNKDNSIIIKEERLDLLESIKNK